MSSLKSNSQQLHTQSSSSEDEDELGKLAVQLANAVILLMALKSAIELNVIDIITSASDDTFLSPSNIASKIQTKNPDAPVLLNRVLRLLASHSILKCSLRTGYDGGIERLYGVGPICRFLTKNDGGGSVGPLFLLHHDKIFMESWDILQFHDFQFVPKIRVLCEGYDSHIAQVETYQWPYIYERPLRLLPIDFELDASTCMNVVSKLGVSLLK